ncbi:MAG: tetratricopeptide repeat protein [bacterium]|nr:tetratricopeptide repeat protein [bacterium]
MNHLNRSLIAVTGFLGLHILMVFWQSAGLWGVDMLSYVSTWIQGLFIFLSGLLVYAGLRQMPQPMFERFSFPVTPFLIILAILAFIGLRSAIHLLGDGYLLIRELEEGVLISLHKNEPLSLWLLATLHNTSLSAETTGRLYSVLSGIFYVFLTLPVCRLLGQNRLEKILILAFLITPGFLQLFFGYIETYSLLFPFILLYLLFGFQTLRNNLPIWRPAALLGLLIPLHFATASFLPSLLALIVFRARMENRLNLKHLLVSLGVLPVTTLLLFLVLDFHPLIYLMQESGSHFLPLLSPSDISPYPLLSLQHLSDFLNQQLLVIPSTLLVLPLAFGARSPRNPDRSFLLIAALFPLLLSFLGNPKIGAFRDWDALALPAVPLTLWAALFLMVRIQNPHQQIRIGFLIGSATGLHTLLWVGLNAHSVSSEDRYQHLLHTSHLSPYARSFGFESLGTYYREQGRVNQALKAYQNALDINPDHPRYSQIIGLLYYQQGQYQESISYSQKAIEIQPDFLEAIRNLGNAYIRLGESQKAIPFLQEGLEQDPSNSQIHNSLAAAYFSLNQHTKAIHHFQKAIAFDAQNLQAYYNLGTLYGELREIQNQRACFQKILELDPSYPRAAKIRTWLKANP